MSHEATLESGPDWHPTSGDPNDEQFGDIVDPTALTEADEYTAALVREPYDGAVIGRPGAREGPSAVCDALAGVKTHHFDAGPVRSVGDLGTIEVPADIAVSDAQAAIREQTATIHDQETVPVFLGGDNSLTYANVAPLLEQAGSVGVVSLDAHLDCRAVQGEPTSGTPYRQLWDAGLDDMAVLGARHFETSTTYADYLRERGGDIVTAEEVGDDPVEAAERALTAVDADLLYISVDMDVLDVTAGPGVSAPTPGGITTRELFRMVRLLAGSGDVAGLEVVETAPPLCPDGRTADAAARTIAHALSALETRAQTGGEGP